jgi:Family of unknown function (DUF5330)
MMWFLLRLTFWLSIVLVLLPSVGTHPVPKSQVSASEALKATRVVLADLQHFCERQQEACDAGSLATVTLGERAQAGAKMLYEFLSEHFEPRELRPSLTTGSVPLPSPRPSQHTFRPPDLAPPPRAPQPEHAP